MGRYEQNIVLDLEFTAVDKEKRTRGFGREIIQIGAVRIAPDGAVLDSFSAYVRPEFASRVSPKVQALTGIRTCDVSNADSLEVVLGAFRQWVGQASTRFVAWSGSDLAQLSQETAYKQLAFPEGDGRWMDLQVVYPRVMGVGNGRDMSLRNAASWYGIKVSEENLHGALYDTRVTAELLRNLITKDYVEQKLSLPAAMPEKACSKPMSFTIGEKFSSLMAFKLGLEAATVAA